MAIGNSILFVDAYDSFSQNIVALLDQETGADITLVRIDTDLEQRFGRPLEGLVAQFDAIVLGPGPGNPNESKDVGNLNELFDAAAVRRVPILGICLGFQVLCIKYGLRIERMKEPCHGQPKSISYITDGSTFSDGRDIFEDIDTGDLWATCYNSLGLVLQDTLCSPNPSRPGSSGTNSSFSSTSSHWYSSSGTSFRVLAIDKESNVMAIRHRHLPFWGVQFHPESCKSNYLCRQLIRNWWAAAQRNKTEVSPMCTEQILSRDHAIPIKNEQLQPMPPGKCTGSSTVSSTTTAILSHLLQASITTANHVQWAKINATCSRTQISDLVHDLSDSHHIAMLESTKKGRFSIYAVLTKDIFRENRGNNTSFVAWQARYQQSQFHINTLNSQTGFSITAHQEDVWHGLELLLTHRRATGGPAQVPFWGGFIGYLSYEHGLDRLVVRSQDSTARTIPEISLLWVERSIVYDNLTQKIYVQSIRKHDQAFVNDMASLLSTPSRSWSRSQLQSAHQSSALQKILDAAHIKLPNPQQYDSHFHRCQSELRAGNSYELCLTTEATISIDKSDTNTPYEFELYKNLHMHNPVPFGAFLKLSGITILGTSPEQYMSWSRTGIIDMIPMKGTVKRSADMTIERASLILSSPKESAENLMIADLIRHDLYSSVGHQAKVEVVKLCEVIEHETVYQLVSHIRAHAPIVEHLSDDEKQQQAIHYGFKTLRQTMPPGSMTGAPKKRSCEILAELEDRNRGVYSGVLGFMDVGGGGNWSVCIRTAFRYGDDGKNQHDEETEKDIWHLGAGGAITVLSDAEGEWQEMMVKLNSVLKGFMAVDAADKI